MASSTWWLDPRETRYRGDQLGAQPYDPFGLRQPGQSSRDPRERDPRDRDDPRDPRQQYDPRNVLPAVPQGRPVADEATAAAAAVPQQRSLLDMLGSALGNPSSAKASEGERSGYGPIPTLGGGTAMDPRRAMMVSQMGLRMMNPYAYGGYR